jgi:hypothetical protein
LVNSQKAKDPVGKIIALDGPDTDIEKGTEEQAILAIPKRDNIDLDQSVHDEGEMSKPNSAREAVLSVMSRSCSIMETFDGNDGASENKKPSIKNVREK